MKNIIQKSTQPRFISDIGDLHSKTNKWLSEIEFIKVEQKFLNELISDHIIGLCKSDNFKKGKLLLNGINHEAKLSEKLVADIKEHRINLSLLIEHIYIKKENDFRKENALLKIEVENYIQNFKYIKEQVFELVLFIMKKEKEKKLLHK
jgi:tRNA/tmRNA/rRNA uracil-C5-methylase (TrmA/RlmC/RlmD family)